MFTDLEPRILSLSVGGCFRICYQWRLGILGPRGGYELCGARGLLVRESYRRARIIKRSVFRRLHPNESVQNGHTRVRPTVKQLLIEPINPHRVIGGARALEDN